MATLLWRPAGIGDAIWLTAALPLLHRAGRGPVDVCVNRHVAPVFANNPHVRAVRILEEQLDDKGRGLLLRPPDIKYLNSAACQKWEAEQRGEYDTVISLGGVIETRALWREHDSPEEFHADHAARQTDLNYTDAIVSACGFPGVVGALPRLYCHSAETATLDKIEPLADGALAWHVSGTAYHKVNMQTGRILERFLALRPEAFIYLLGDHTYHGKWVKARVSRGTWDRCRDVTGVLSLREQLVLCSGARAVAGPESAFVNAAAAWGVPAVVFYSHSKHANLSRHWPNAYPVHPSAACHPCYKAFDTAHPLCFYRLGDLSAGAICCNTYPDNAGDVVSAAYGPDPLRTCPACGVRDNRADLDGGFSCACGVRFGVPAAAPAPTPQPTRAPETTLGGVDAILAGLRTMHHEPCGILYKRRDAIGERVPYGVASPLPPAVLGPALRAAAAAVEQKGGTNGNRKRKRR